MNQWTKCTKLPEAKLQRMLLNKKAQRNVIAECQRKKTWAKKNKVQDQDHLDRAI